MAEDLIDFDIEKASPSIIMVAGVGGGGGNAVNYMFRQGIADVTFMMCNTDQQVLDKSPVPIKITIGENLTEGLGAGNDPEVGRAAALESLDEIVGIFRREGTKMVFVTAGMGGGTGTGAAPIIAKAAKELGILTVGIVTIPFREEGEERMEYARQGIENMQKNVDSLLVIDNENISDMYGDLPMSEAFGKADDILATAAKGIAEIITGSGVINVDFADVRTVMSDSGVALMGSGQAGGEDRALKVAELALSSPLLNHNHIVGAKKILINITSGLDEIRMKEAGTIIKHIQDKAGNKANIIWGAGHNDALGGDIKVTLIATGFDVDAPVERQMEDFYNKGAEMSKDGTVPEEAGDEEMKEPRVKWTPPTDTGTNPFAHKKPSAAPGVPPAASNAHQAPVGNQVLKVSEHGKYKNIEEIIDSPAYVRRKVKFEDAPEEALKGAKVAIKDEQPQNKPDSGGGSLFD